MFFGEYEWDMFTVQGDLGVGVSFWGMIRACMDSWERKTTKKFLWMILKEMKCVR